MATTCEVSGNSDMYGLGIRIGFYLQWMSSPATAWIARDETSSLRTANAFFVSATFIGLVIETALNHLDVVEIYVILLLGFGAQYSWLVAILWRVATNFRANWDPTRHMRTPPPSKMFWFLYTIVQVAQIVFQLWFWLYKIPRTDNECARFGFAFFRVRLTNNGFRIFNIVLMVALLVLTVVFFVLHFRQLSREGRLLPWAKPAATTQPEVHKKRKRDRDLEEREQENEQQQHRQLDGKHDKAEQSPTHVPSAAPPSEKPGSKSDPTKTSVRSEAELERRMTEIDEMRHHQDEYAASYTVLEQEVQSLRVDKRAFEKLVATLQEKIRHLEILEEWEEPSGVLGEREEEEEREQKEREEKREEKRENVLCIIETVFRVVSGAIVILVTELTIAWNKIQGVNDTKSVGQLIPLMIGVGGIGHVLLVATREAMNESKPVDATMQDHSHDERYNMGLFPMAFRRDGESRATSASDMTEAEGHTSAGTSITTSVSSQEE